jgi:glucan 1,3-beta-glucosidase
MVNSSRVVVHGSAMWSFFNGMDDGLWSDPQCGATGGICQTNMAYVEGARATWWFSLSSKAAENLVVDAGGVAGGNGSGTVITSQRDNPGSWGAVVAAYLRNTGNDDEGKGEGDGGEDSGGARVKGEGLGMVVAIVALFIALMCVELV